MTALNRLQLTYASDFDTKFVLGRQRLLIGNQRFIGNSGWRQHEQTFDALSAVNTSIPGLSLTYAYLYRVNRVYGPDLPVPSNTAPAATGQANYFKSNSHVMNGVYTGMPGLRLEGYAYLLDFHAPGYAVLPAQSHGHGASFPPPPMARGGLQPSSDRRDRRQNSAANSRTRPTIANNPLSFGLNYFLGEAAPHGTAPTAWSVTKPGRQWHHRLRHAAGDLARFQWLGRPVPHHAHQRSEGFLCQAGLWHAGGFCDVKSLNLNATYHDFKTDNLNRGIGSEWDLQAELTVDASLSFMAKYANYAGSGAAFGGFADKSVFWLQTAYKYSVAGKIPTANVRFGSGGAIPPWSAQCPLFPQSSHSPRSANGCFAPIAAIHNAPIQRRFE